MTSTSNATKFFVVSYTNKVKDYCDKEFFERFNEIATGHLSLVVDNTPGREYFEKLIHLTPYVAHIDIDASNKEGLFQRNVAESVALCREKFLASDADVMVIIESDVIPPADLLERFDKRIQEYLKWIKPGTIGLGDGTLVRWCIWGALGGLYYPGFHDFSLEGIAKTGHVLSGCTAYRRELLEKYPFRYDPANLAAFPDALICHDANQEYSFWNDHDIICKHLHRGDGGRMSCEL